MLCVTDQSTLNLAPPGLFCSFSLIRWSCCYERPIFPTTYKLLGNPIGHTLTLSTALKKMTQMGPNQAVIFDELEVKQVGWRHLHWEHNVHVPLISQTFHYTTPHRCTNSPGKFTAVFKKSPIQMRRIKIHFWGMFKAGTGQYIFLSRCASKDPESSRNQFEATLRREQSH